MPLTPTGRDRLPPFAAAEPARARRARSLWLDVPEAIAPIADTVCEAACGESAPGEVLPASDAVAAPVPAVTLAVRNTATVPVSSGATDEVGPVPVGGDRIAIGFAGLPQPVLKSGSPVYGVSAAPRRRSPYAARAASGRRAWSAAPAPAMSTRTPGPGS
ncbi:urease subunit gamma [Streptomyces sp. NPDC059752]|uniref:urease subunit gamma n=1 Tax=unclassified Streptomyces TaxID=2593676 RepID=UPI00364EDF42